MKKVFGFIGGFGPPVLAAAELVFICSGLFGYDYVPFNIFLYGGVLIAVYLLVCLSAMLCDAFAETAAKQIGMMALCFCSVVRLVVLQFAADHWFVAIMAVCCVPLTLIAYNKTSSALDGAAAKYTFSRGVVLMMTYTLLVAGIIFWSVKLFVPSVKPYDSFSVDSTTGYIAEISATRVMGSRYDVQVEVVKAGKPLLMGRFLGTRPAPAYSEFQPVEGYARPEVEWRGSELYVNGEPKPYSF